MFGVESVRYNGKVLLQREKLESVVEGLERKGVKVVVGVVDYLRLGRGGVEGKKKNGWWKWEDLKEMGRSAREKKGEGAEMEFWQGEFGAPLWVLFSSGTTGKVGVRYCSWRVMPLSFGSLIFFSFASPFAAEADCSSRRRDAYTVEEGTRAAWQYGTGRRILLLYHSRCAFNTSVLAISRKLTFDFVAAWMMYSKHTREFTSIFC